VSAVASRHDLGSKSDFATVMIEGSRAGEAIGHLRSRAFAPMLRATELGDRGGRQMRRTLTAVAVGITVAVALAGCAWRSSLTSTDGLLTFSWRSDVSCSEGSAARPVVGTLRGQADARGPIWLEAEDGVHLSVAWPDGFTVSFSPTVELRDDRGEVVARDGDQITLTQTNLDEAAGTQGDPYVAKGSWLAGRCYPFV
jgi:hypothetical protein